jgi:hypothetical protein
MGRHWIKAEEEWGCRGGTTSYSHGAAMTRGVASAAGMAKRGGAAATA